tara:strand:- start:2 stop:550 length:549 start_codon:yes stop_codon:yes gene_type:complete
MAAYPENTGGIISAIQACIVAAGGTLTTAYDPNTGGIIQALIALQTAINEMDGGGGGGTGSALEIELTAAENLAIGDVVYIDANGKLAKAAHNSTRDIATVAGLVRLAATANSTAKLIFTGKINVTGWSGGTLTTGARYFLNGTGTISLTPPSGANEYLVLVGEALDANTLALNIDVPVLLK